VIRFLKFILVSATVVVAASLPPVSSVAAFKYLDRGMKAPTVSGTDILSGEKVSSDDGTGLENEAVCVFFWATWSPRSLQLMSDLSDLRTELSDQPFRVVAVNVDSQVTTSAVRDRVRRALEQIDPGFPVIMDEKLEYFYEFGVIAVPSAVILDADRVVRAAPSGYSATIRAHLALMVDTVLGMVPMESQVASRPVYEPDLKASRYYRLAVQLSNQRLYESALAKIELATAADVRFSAPWGLRGQIYLSEGQPTEAKDAFLKAVSLDSLSVSSRAGLGRALLELGEMDAAREQLEMTLALERTYPAALQDLARCHASAGEYQQAIGLLQEAIELNPREPEIYYYLGKTCREAGQNASHGKV
jgi:alkyl hydroperoxide reductase subunit AhpC